MIVQVPTYTPATATKRISMGGGISESWTDAVLKYDGLCEAFTLSPQKETTLFSSDIERELPLVTSQVLRMKF